MTDSLPVRLSRPVSDSQHVTSELIMPHDANILGHAFGGATSGARHHEFIEANEVP